MCTFFNNYSCYSPTTSIICSHRQTYYEQFRSNFFCLKYTLSYTYITVIVQLCYLYVCQNYKNKRYIPRLLCVIIWTHFTQQTVEAYRCWSYQAYYCPMKPHTAKLLPMLYCVKKKWFISYTSLGTVKRSFCVYITVDTIF